MVENLTRPSIVTEIINRHNFKISKSLGQNFLIDDSIRQKIVASAEINSDDIVVEIGPGLGVLTQSLLARGCQVIAVELDKRLIPILEENFKKHSNFHLVNDDLLKVNLDQLVKEVTKTEQSYKVIANLPYYITTPIIMYLLESRFNIELMVFMMQKEVAERIVAKPGTKIYGSLSVAVQYFTEPQFITKVPKNVFIPKPDVESAVVRFTTRATPPIELEDEAIFFKIVRAAFGQRRKTLLNSLTSHLPLTKEEVLSLLQETGIEPTRRGETLSLDEFGNLSNIFFRVLC